VPKLLTTHPHMLSLLPTPTLPPNLISPMRRCLAALCIGCCPGASGPFTAPTRPLCPLNGSAPLPPPGPALCTACVSSLITHIGSEGRVAC
jgi:hypothetical protein